jgi:flagellar biosynthesis protein FlhB
LQPERQWETAAVGAWRTPEEKFETATEERIREAREKGPRKNDKKTRIVLVVL